MYDALVEQMLQGLREFIFKIHQEQTLPESPHTFDLRGLQDTR